MAKLSLEDIQESSKFMTGLSGYTNVTELNKIQIKFNQFSIGGLDSAPNEFNTWQEAWKRFEEVYNSQLPSRFADWCEDPSNLKPVGSI